MQHVDHDAADHRRDVDESLVDVLHRGKCGRPRPPAGRHVGKHPEQANERRHAAQPPVAQELAESHADGERIGGRVVVGRRRALLGVWRDVGAVVCARTRLAWHLRPVGKLERSEVSPAHRAAQHLGGLRLAPPRCQPKGRLGQAAQRNRKMNAAGNAIAKR